MPEIVWYDLEPHIHQLHQDLSQLSKPQIVDTFDRKEVVFAVVNTVDARKIRLNRWQLIPRKHFQQDSQLSFIYQESQYGQTSKYRLCLKIGSFSKFVSVEDMTKIISYSFRKGLQWFRPVSKEILICVCGPLADDDKPLVYAYTGTREHDGSYYYYRTINDHTTLKFWVPFFRLHRREHCGSYYRSRNNHFLLVLNLASEDIKHDLVYMNLYLRMIKRVGEEWRSIFLLGINGEDANRQISTEVVQRWADNNSVSYHEVPGISGLQLDTFFDIFVRDVRKQA